VVRIDLAHDWDKQRALVNAHTDFIKFWKKHRVATKLVASRVVLSSIELVLYQLQAALFCVWGGRQFSMKADTNKQTQWPLVRERTIPTERPPLVDEI
jgi:hypothetical protein